MIEWINVFQEKTLKIIFSSSILIGKKQDLIKKKTKFDIHVLLSSSSDMLVLLPQVTIAIVSSLSKEFQWTPMTPHNNLNTISDCGWSQLLQNTLYNHFLLNKHWNTLYVCPVSLCAGIVMSHVSDVLSSHSVVKWEVTDIASQGSHRAWPSGLSSAISQSSYLSSQTWK